jgi:hypothetical protein
MKADIEDFKSGWYGLTLGMKSDEIDDLISALKNLKENKNHFHFRSEFEGVGGVGDIEIYWQPNEGESNLELDVSLAIYTTENKHN